MTQKTAILGLIVLAILSSGGTYLLVDRSQPDWFITFWGVVGTNLSVLGVLYTLIQISFIKSETEIIRGATVETRDRIEAMNRFGDVSKAIKLIQEIQGYARSRKYEAAVMRLQELKIIIGQMKSFNASLSQPLDLESIITRLNQHINGMEKDIEFNTMSVKITSVNSSLEKILDTLVHIQTETLRRN